MQFWRPEEMDSFFDFDTSLPPVKDGRRWASNGAGGSNLDPVIDSEGEYDALNDETFGDPDKGDWENMHETLVRLESGESSLLPEDDVFQMGKLGGLFEDDELDLHLSRFDFGDDDESLCSSVGDLSLDEDIATRLRLDPSIWDSPAKQTQGQGFSQRGSRNMFPDVPVSNVQNDTVKPYGSHFTGSVPIKMLSVEDIERNIIEQQRQERLKTEKKGQWKLQQEIKKNKEVKKPIPIPTVSPATIQHVLPPAPLLTVRNQIFPPPPLLNHQSRVPVGFLPYSFLPTHYSTPINNLAMHPSFPNGLGHQLGLFPRIPLPIQPSLIQNIQNNQFNRKLVQEIQQNHPMLSFHRLQSQQNNTNHHKNYNNQRYHGNIPRGGGADFDEYANMMTNREKQWLISIQLAQLNSDTPYINDYYFTVYKERLTSLRGSNESKAYKDNQLNHPFTQPKGHAQLLLMSSLARNCGGIINRERKNSESTKAAEQKEQHRSYTPLQFENSLGKLQCGSVKAPRKIIDMDVVGTESPNALNSAGLELSMQRKSRHVLLHIETLYKVVLKMEDLKNPTAIEAAMIVKEKREKDLLLQKQNYDQQPDQCEPEKFDELLEILTGGLSQDKVILMVGVRKGKILLRRVCVLLREHPFRWTLWKFIFSAIPFMLKKDRDDQEGVLFALYTEFERHVQYSRFVELLDLSQVIAVENVLLFLTSCKFLLSSVITVIFQMEVFVSQKTPDPIAPTDLDKWIHCLCLVTGIANKLLSAGIAPKPSAHHLIKIERDNNIVRTVRVHLERYPHQVKGNDFLDFITAETAPFKNGIDAVAIVEAK